MIKLLLVLPLLLTGCSVRVYEAPEAPRVYKRYYAVPRHQVYYAPGYYYR